MTTATTVTAVLKFSENEYINYQKKEGKKFETPELEHEWALTQYKTCTKCNCSKSLTSYMFNTSGRDIFDKDGHRLRRPECQECTKEASKGKNEAKALAKKLGISYKAPDDAICEICKKLGTRNNGLVFDHCHEKNIFRGYCCNSCNRSMGVLGDNVEGLVNVINYLIKNDPKKIVQNDDGSLSIV